MNNLTKKSKIEQIKKHKTALLDQQSEVSLSKILSAESCQRIIRTYREFRDSLYTPMKTIFMFVKQVLNPDKSCRNAVASVIVEQICKDKDFSSTNTGQYTLYLLVSTWQLNCSL